MPDDIGVLAPGGGTQGITRAGQAELTRQRFANTSLPTRALGMALGAAETLVPAAGSPKETLRTLAKAARDYIVHGTERGFARQAFEQGFDTGGAAAAGDPHAQGAALAAVGNAALGVKAIYGRAAEALPPRVAKANWPTPDWLREEMIKRGLKPDRILNAVDLNNQSVVDALKSDPFITELEKTNPELAARAKVGNVSAEELRAAMRSTKPPLDPLDVPAYQRTTAPVRQRFATDQEVRLHVLRQQYAEHTAESILPNVEAAPQTSQMAKIQQRAQTEFIDPKTISDDAALYAIHGDDFAPSGESKVALRVGGHVATGQNFQEAAVRVAKKTRGWLLMDWEQNAIQGGKYPYRRMGDPAWTMEVEHGYETIHGEFVSDAERLQAVQDARAKLEQHASSRRRKP